MCPHTGVYKPRIRCYDVYQLSMKFERCVDAEVVNFNMLSEDYSKVIIIIYCIDVVLFRRFIYIGSYWG